jgi:hypothetical protein
MLHVGQKVFFGAPTPAACVNSDPPWPMAAVLVVLMIGCVFVPAIAMSLADLIGG